MSGLLRPNWPAPANVHAGFTLRDATLGALPSEPRWLKQVHGTRVVRFHADVDAEVARAGAVPAAANSRDTPDTREEADAAVTSDPGVVLVIRTADCMPVLFCSEDGRELGAAHAGWRGLAAGVLEATLDAMPVPPDGLLAWFGPAASVAHYEVGEDVRAAFAGHERHFVPTRPGHWLVDLHAIARDKLAVRGLIRTSGGEWCTIADPRRFHSHRRDGDPGRHITAIWRD